MKRRSFIASGAVLLSSGIVAKVNRPSVGLEFEVQNVPEKDPRNLKNILLEFSNFKLTPQYVNLDKNPAKINIVLEIDDKNETQESVEGIDVELKNGKTHDLVESGVVDSIRAPINTDDALLDCKITIGLEHGAISEEYSESFTVSTPDIPQTSGGTSDTITTPTGDQYNLQVFTSDGNFDIDQDAEVDVLVVGGGGAGGSDNVGGGGGGGAGGVVYDSDHLVSAGSSVNVTVGGGGSPSSDSAGSNGGDSSFGSLVAKGGGGGANGYNIGHNGGSAGGTGQNADGSAVATQPGTNNSDIDAGSPTQDNVTNNHGTGGGGASETGYSGTGEDESRGGDGVDLSDIFTDKYGENGFFGGGGAGGQNAGNGVTHRGGKGGGSDSPTKSSGTPSPDAMANTGGGGAGASGDDLGAGGGNGGSGIVIVRIGPL